jgi:hypothetical protein
MKILNSVNLKEEISLTKKLIFDKGPRLSEFGKKKYLIANRKLMVIPNVPSLYFSIHNTSNV